MKSIRQIGAVAIAALLLTACNPVKMKMHTTIYADGSCIRDVSYSNVMPKAMRDSVWPDGKTGWSQPMPECLNIDAFCKSHTDIGKGDTVTTTFSCPFSNVEEMCGQTPLQLNGTRLKSKAKLDKRFRWFYTDYTFTETFLCVGDTFKLDAKTYANKDIVSYWFTGEPNLVQGLSGAEASLKLNEIEPFVSRWLNDNLFKVVFDYVVSRYDSIPSPPVSRERFCELHDSLFNHLVQDRDDLLLYAHAGDAFRDFFHSDAYGMFFDDETPLGKELNTELCNRLNIFWFNVPYTLTMPGTVIDTGRGTQYGDIIFYPFTGERLIPGDYTVTATSRVTNYWAYVVTLLVMAIAVTGIFYRRKK